MFLDNAEKTLGVRATSGFPPLKACPDPWIRCPSASPGQTLCLAVILQGPRDWIRQDDMICLGHIAWGQKGTRRINTSKRASRGIHRKVCRCRGMWHAMTQEYLKIPVALNGGGGSTQYIETKLQQENTKNDLMSSPVIPWLLHRCYYTEFPNLVSSTLLERREPHNTQFKQYGLLGDSIWKYQGNLTFSIGTQIIGKPAGTWWSRMGFCHSWYRY